MVANPNEVRDILVSLDPTEQHSSLRFLLPKLIARAFALLPLGNVIQASPLAYLWRGLFSFWFRLHFLHFFPFQIITAVIIIIIVVVVPPPKSNISFPVILLLRAHSRAISHQGRRRRRRRPSEQAKQGWADSQTRSSAVEYTRHGAKRKRGLIVAGQETLNLPYCNDCVLHK